MVIDFHTHTFPDSIVEKAMAKLSAAADIEPYRNGTVDSLTESMNAGGVDMSVVLPVATSAKQVDGINRLSAELNGKRGMIFSGAIHPDCENVDEILDGIKAAGLFGIKLHPDYQGVYFDDPRYVNIIRKAAERDLITVTHAGIDLAFPDDIHCTPDRVLNVLGELGGVADGKLVLAHMGGVTFLDEVAEKLVGKPVYLDTAFVLDIYPEKCIELIRRHGADKVLFATDSPWKGQREFVDLFRSLPLSEKERELIFSENARRLLDLK